MAVSPFRALAAAHLHTTWNRLRRQSGTTGLITLGLVLVFLVATFVLPLLASLAALGFFGSSAWGTHDGTRVTALGAVLATALTLFAGIVGGISTGSRQLPWETLKVFPVNSFTLFCAELFAGAFEAITLVELGALTAGTVGGMVGAPVAAPLLLIFWLTHGFAILGLQQLFGSIAQRVSRRLRAVLIVLPVLAVAMSWLAPMLAKRINRGSFESWGDRFASVAAWLPAHFVLDAAHALVQGKASVAQLLWAGLMPVALCLVILALGFFFVARERPLETTAHDTKAVRLWSFNSQVMGVARLQWASLAQSIPGRFGMVMPLLTIVLIRGPLAESLPGRGWTAPLAFGYASLAGTNLLFNQFGLDRHGVKLLFLLPVEPVALLRGKLLGFAAWQAVQALMLLGLLVLTGHTQVFELMTGLGMYVCIFLIFSMVGQFASIWQPRPLKKNGLRASQPPMMVVLMVFGSLVTAGALLFGVVYGIRLFAPGWELAVVMSVGVMLLFLTEPVLKFNALFLNRNREKLVEVLGAAD